MVAEILPAPSEVDIPVPAKGTFRPWSFTNPLNVNPELPARVAAVHCCAFATGTRLAKSNGNDISASIGVAKVHLIAVLLSDVELGLASVICDRTSRTVARHEPKIKDQGGGLLVLSQVADFCRTKPDGFLGRRSEEGC